jgi:hypothetical protein
MDGQKKGLYIETTIPSYGSGRTSGNSISAGKQASTKQFWEQNRQKFNLYVSDYVVVECGDGDFDAAKRRLDFIKGITILPESTKISELATIYQNLLNIPDDAKMDCFHLAVCVLNRIDFLLTWNFTHLGPSTYKKAKVYNDKNGLWTPELVTPETIYVFMQEDV